MEPRGIFSMAVPAEVLAAALADRMLAAVKPSAVARGPWGAVPDYFLITVDGRRMLKDVKRISFCSSHYWPTVVVASSRGGAL